MPGSKTVTIAAVGDFMIQHRPPQYDIDRVKSLVCGADITIANVDTVLSDAGQPSPKWANLRGPRDVARDLAAMGFDVVTFANNHAMDFRAEGMLDMIAAYGEAGVKPIGGGTTIAEATAPHLVTVGDRTVALLSLATTLPPDAAAGPTWPGIAPVKVHQAYAFDASLFAEQPGSMPDFKGWLDETDLQRAIDDVKAAKDRADIVVPCIHWGVPSPWRAPIHPIIQEHQRELGHALIDAGADAIIGNHAHELHGIEFYEAKPIAYCLGNFWIDKISNWAWMGRESIVLRLNFPPDGDPEVEIQPVWLDDDGWPLSDPDHKAVAILNALGKNDRVSVTPAGDRFRVAASR
jgi:poly-gamma-glutamate capsule biosynthesis protein CapA/YwtB (metallophosphatase superfamily)